MMKATRALLVLVTIASVVLAACTNKVAEAPKRVDRLAELCIAKDGSVPVLAQIQAQRNDYVARWDKERARVSRQVAGLNLSPLDVSTWCGRLEGLRGDLAKTTDITDKKTKEGALASVYDRANESVTNLEGSVTEPQREYNSASSALGLVQAAESQLLIVQVRVASAPYDAVNRTQAGLDLTTAQLHINSAWGYMASGNWSSVGMEVLLANSAMNDAEENASPPTATPQPTRTPEPALEEDEPTTQPGPSGPALRPTTPSNSGGPALRPTSASVKQPSGPALRPTPGKTK